MKKKLTISSLIGLISVVAIAGLIINGNSKAQHQSGKENSHAGHSVSQVHSHGEQGTDHDHNAGEMQGNVQAKLTVAQPIEPNKPISLTAGKPVSLVFNLKDAATNQPVKDLQPYLGERGHLVIVKLSSPLTKADYIHAHAHTMPNIPPGEVNFMTEFPLAGKYKLWGQFNRQGKIVTTDFWVNVN